MRRLRGLSTETFYNILPPCDTKSWGGTIFGRVKERDNPLPFLPRPLGLSPRGSGEEGSLAINLLHREILWSVIPPSLKRLGGGGHYKLAFFLPHAPQKPRSERLSSAQHRGSVPARSLPQSVQNRNWGWML